MLGAAHYSYYFAEQLFRSMMARHGAAPVLLAMPEYYATADALPGEAGGMPVHLIFRATDRIRLLKPGINISCFAWEFAVLKADTLPGEHPFANQGRMLGLCDEVWTPSRFGCRVLAAHGIDRVQHIPAPVPLPARRPARAEALSGIGEIDAVPLRVNFLWQRSYGEYQAQQALAPLRDWLGRHGSKPTVYLSICNPEDFRKNLDAMLRGFHLFRARRPDSVLILKALTSRSIYTLPQLASDVVPNKLAPGSVIEDDGILLINAFLSDDEMSLLYGLADFYLCTSIAEGQNLPLLEAMAHGTIAVSPRNTAMDDYIDDDNAFVIATRIVPNDSEHLAGTVAQRPFDVSMCGAGDVCDALCRTRTATKPERTRMARAGIATLVAQFSEATVWSRVQSRLDHYNR